MANGTRAGRPGNSTAHNPRTQTALDRALLELEKQKLVESLANGRVMLTVAGYQALEGRRFPRRRS